jgi:hypothetical protein
MIGKSLAPHLMGLRSDFPKIMLTQKPEARWRFSHRALVRFPSTGLHGLPSCGQVAALIEWAGDEAARPSARKETARNIS